MNEWVYVLTVETLVFELLSRRECVVYWYSIQ